MIRNFIGRWNTTVSFAVLVCTLLVLFIVFIAENAYPRCADPLLVASCLLSDTCDDPRCVVALCKTDMMCTLNVSTPCHFYNVLLTGDECPVDYDAQDMTIKVVVFVIIGVYGLLQLSMYIIYCCHDACQRRKGSESYTMEVTRDFSLNCPDCDGGGLSPGPHVSACPTCNGTGQLPAPSYQGGYSSLRKDNAITY